MADNSILTRLDGLKLEYEEIGQKLTDPEVIADVKQFIQFNKEYRELEPIIEASERYRTAIANLTESGKLEHQYKLYLICSILNIIQHSLKFRSALYALSRLTFI